MELLIIKPAGLTQAVTEWSEFEFCQRFKCVLIKGIFTYYEMMIYSECKVNSIFVQKNITLSSILCRQPNISYLYLMFDVLHNL